MHSLEQVVATTEPAERCATGLFCPFASHVGAGPGPAVTLVELGAALIDLIPVRTAGRVPREVRHAHFLIMVQEAVIRLVRLVLGVLAGGARMVLHLPRAGKQPVFVDGPSAKPSNVWRPGATVLRESCRQLVRVADEPILIRVTVRAVHRPEGAVLREGLARRLLRESDRRLGVWHVRRLFVARVEAELVVLVPRDEGVGLVSALAF